ncbi:MAG: sarcosine oxidase subunit gamma [Hyphomicrobiaceae bacterium]|nr:MAG: sarcosine oxidase subunit gamma [Hyphomicrobiaceae bacterium]
MAETEMRSSPLSGRPLAVGKLTVREIAFEGKISLRGSGESFHAAVRFATGLALPEKASTATTGNGRRALWLGPDEWLLIVADAERDAMLGRLTKALAGQHAAVVDVSAGRTVIEIKGDKARALLEKGCLLDLHPRSAGPGACLSTTIAKSGVVIEQTGAEPPSYRLYLRPSFARHFALWIGEAARDLTD